MRADGVVIAEIHIFADGDYEYTGRTMVINSGAESWNADQVLTDIIRETNKIWPDSEGFEVMGIISQIYKNP